MPTIEWHSPWHTSSVSLTSVNMAVVSEGSQSLIPADSHSRWMHNITALFFSPSAISLLPVIKTTLKLWLVLRDWRLVLRPSNPSASRTAALRIVGPRLLKSELQPSIGGELDFCSPRPICWSSYVQWGCTCIFSKLPSAGGEAVHRTPV